MARRKTKERLDHYQDVTDRIIESLEKGVRPWNKPWNEDKAFPTWPRNATTEHRYRGINILLLMCHPLSFESDPRWCTYNQAKEKGWQVRKGEKGIRIYYYKTLKIKDGSKDSPDDEQEEPAMRTIPLLRSYTVFHASQIDDIPLYELPTNDGNEFTPIEEGEALLNNSSAEIHHGGPRAFYSPSTDHIQLPPKVPITANSAPHFTLNRQVISV